MGFMDGGGETSLSMIRFRMGTSQSRALDMSRCLYLIIGYLVRDEWKDLKFVSYG